ncbi:hypothetical protein BCU84_19515 [Shewanella sp. 10N.286.51.B7]|uniref:phage integrase N-terminal domain-containing protein n=1 Tax=unclassified Shewanella TaxID=196818 RepID=UPI0006D68F36|nr:MULTISPECIES: phage integrase N-terminal domain-containing protein [unclassified Shewanella]KPZ67251.1 hypothetical protein AN944_04160 [Shewanella sp. P1-14-1]PMG73008.1 hypothetical protein BCU84_19515 [Shewanella sp. 10N.286.51.B7]
MAKGKHNLKWELTRLCKQQHQSAMRAKQEGFATQKNRTDILRLCADQLKVGGFRNMSVKSLKPKHVEHLVKQWHSENIATGTIKNRMSALRWWAEKIGKKDAINKGNEAYGIAKRDLVGAANAKARELDLVKLTSIKDPATSMALELQRAFGLRKTEAILFHPKTGWNGDSITLKGSTCKGGRPRTIPITNQHQTALLNRITATVGDGYLIPVNRNLKQQLEIYKHECGRAKLDRNHGLRHRFARDLYQELSGHKCPADGGVKRTEMTDLERQRDNEIRLEISRALGHERIGVVSVYIGV